MLIGACIPCLYPLVKKLFGPKALGTTTPAYQHHGAVATIGSHPKDRERAKRTAGQSGLATIVDETEGGNSWKHETLEESPVNASTAEQWAAEAVAELGHQQQHQEEEEEEQDDEEEQEDGEEHEEEEQQEEGEPRVEPRRTRTPPGWI